MTQKNKNIVLGAVAIIFIATVAYLTYNANNKNIEKKTSEEYPSYVPVDSITGNPVTPIAPRIFTQSNNNTVIRLKRGEEFILKLGAGEWNISTSRSGIITKKEDIINEGEQGVYTANSAGTTMITAEGGNTCEEGEECRETTFQITIIVE